LSGGQQQMLALARVLMHDPEILLIDELSLGLAPVVVQRMLELVDELKARGQTILVVEQSLNVALAIADRAIFLEKGEVRFEGPAQELLERDDLARAVFFGTEGG
jgi:ABC-type branched-subunit amino acid transport system ATPase component